MIPPENVFFDDVPMGALEFWRVLSEPPLDRTGRARLVVTVDGRKEASHERDESYGL